MRTRSALRLFSLLLAVGACGAPKPPTHQLTRSQAAIRAAEEVDAEKTPKAALHLKMARDNQAAAQQMISAQDQYGEAELALRRAEADAEVAIALAKEAKAQAEADEARNKVSRLKKEME